MNALAEIVPTDLEAEVLREVTAHPHGAALGAFCFDVLSGQAEGRTVIAGRPYVMSRAELHGVTREVGDTALGNVLDLLGRGPKAPEEFALLSAFLVRGIRDAPALDYEVLRAHLGWLERETAYAPYRFVPVLLPAARAAPLWTAIANACSAKATAPSEEGLRAFHLAILRDARDPVADAALCALAEDPADALARVYSPAAPGEAAVVPVLEGDGYRTQGVTGIAKALRLLAWLSGVAVLRATLRGLWWLCGGRTRCRGTLLPTGLCTERTDTLLGRTVFMETRQLAFTAVGDVAIRQRFPLFLTCIGLMFFSIGIIVGGGLLASAARSGETVLLLAGASVLLLGTSIDWLFDGLIPRLRGQTTLAIGLFARRLLLVRGVHPVAATAFLEAARAQGPVLSGDVAPRGLNKAR